MMTTQLRKRRKTTKLVLLPKHEDALLGMFKRIKEDAPFESPRHTKKITDAISPSQTPRTSLSKEEEEEEETEDTDTVILGDHEEYQSLVSDQQFLLLQDKSLSHSSTPDNLN